MPSPKYLNLKPRYVTEGHVNSIPSLSFMKCNMVAKLLLYPKHQRKTNCTWGYKNHSATQF